MQLACDKLKSVQNEMIHLDLTDRTGTLVTMVKGHVSQFWCPQFWAGHQWKSVQLLVCSDVD